MTRRIWLVPAAVLCCAAIACYAEASDVTPHGHTCASATEIKPGGETTAAFESVTDVAIYKIVLEERGLLDVWADWATPDIWSAELLDEACTPIPAVRRGPSVLADRYALLTTPSTDLVTNETVFTLPAATYFIRINPEPINVFGDKFTIHTEFRSHYGHDCATAEPMALNKSIKGELLYPADREVFRVAIDRPGRLHAIAVGESGKLPSISMALANCSSALAMTMPETDPEGEGIGLGTTNLRPGIYYFSISPFGAEDLGKFLFAVGFSPKLDGIDPEAFDGVCMRLSN